MTQDAPTAAAAAQRPEVLHKYRGDSPYTEKIFTTGLVWLSTADQLNDPFECSLQDVPPDWAAARIREMKQAQFEGQFMHLVAAAKKRKSYYGLPQQQVSTFLESLRGQEFEIAYRRLRAFAESASGFTLSDPDGVFQELEDRRNSVGIFSMAEEADNELMWAHYGGEHKGLCIGLSVARGTPLADAGRCLPVRYATTLPAFGDSGFITELQLYGHGQTEVRVSPFDPTFLAVISTKSPRWSYEREWRYVEERGGEYEWPGPISEVTFGLKCPSERREHYLGLIREYVAGDVRTYAIEKTPQANSLKRVLLETIRGRGRADTLRNQGNVMRRSAAGTIRTHVERLMRSDAYDEALAILDEQLAQTPESIAILVQKAAALGLSGKHSEALAIYEDVCARYPEDGTAWYQRGVALSELGRLTDAIDSYRRALAIDPLDASMNFNLGCLLARTGAIPDARDHLDAASRAGHRRARAVIELLDAQGGPNE